MSALAREWLIAHPEACKVSLVSDETSEKKSAAGR